MLAAAVASCASTPSNWNQCGIVAPSLAVMQTEGIGPIPTPGGGTITPGTYDLTDTIVYGARGLISYVTPSAYLFDEVRFQGVARDYAATAGTWSTNGTTLSLTITCRCTKARGCVHGAEAVLEDRARRHALPPVFWYTATATQLVFFESYVNGGIMVQTYARR
jgi:hypothetical protein